MKSLKPLLGLGMYHVLRGRMRFRGLPILLLTTIGAKSGRTRRTLVCWFQDEGRSEARLIVASAAGARRHPAWFHNLWTHPDEVTARVRGHTMRVRPELLNDAERAAVWPRIVALGPEYKRFQEKTARMIPVVRLVPSDDGRGTAGRTPGADRPDAAG